MSAAMPSKVFCAEEPLRITPYYFVRTCDCSFTVPLSTAQSAAWLFLVLGHSSQRVRRVRFFC